VVQELYNASQLVSEEVRKFVNRSSTDSNILNNPELLPDPQLNPGTSCGSHDVSLRSASRNSCANYVHNSLRLCYYQQDAARHYKN
jgi:hypothetical protein